MCYALGCHPLSCACHANTFLVLFFFFFLLYGDPLDLHSFPTRRSSDLLQLHGMTDKSPRNITSALRVNPYFVSEYLDAARNIPMRKVSGIIATIREFDLKSKGVNANAVPQKDLLKELVVRILN